MKTQTDGRRPQPKPGEPKKAPRLKAVRLEPRIAPRRGPCDDDWGCGGNHNETLARDALAKPAGAKPKKASRLRAVLLEPRIAPGTSYQHNETLVREPAKAKAPKARKGRLRATRLEGRVAPGVSLNHNETLVREPAEVKPPAPAARPEPRRSKLHIRKLEERIAPRSGRCEEWGCGMNHNETLARDRA